MSAIPTGRSTPSGIPSGRMTPSGIPASGRVTPSGMASGRATPSGIPARGFPNGRSTPSGVRAPSNGKRDSFGLSSPYSGSSSGTRQRDSLQSPPAGVTTFADSVSGMGVSGLAAALSPMAASPSPTPDGTSVQVALRIRPSGYDVNVPTRFQRTVVTANNPHTVAVDSAPASASGVTAQAKPSRFTFDRVYSPEDGQDAIWSSVEPLVARFLEGYNVTVLAYGQTSSGKSYTMGTDRLEAPVSQVQADRLGIVPRAVHTVFAELDKRSSATLAHGVKTSYIEIYNEDLIDLLASSAAGAGAVLPQVQIREDKEGRIIWSGLREVTVKAVDEVMDHLEAGSAVRQTNSTDMNAQSSRSHAIFSLSLTQKKYIGHGQPSGPPPALGSGFRNSRLPSPRVTSPGPGSRSSTPTEGHRASEDGEWMTVTSKFHFVDLAGSERLKRTAAAGERIKEGISINSGLHALGNVISALGDPSKSKTATHIPYRDSKLTRLLQDSLGGNAHTLMVACVSPSEYNLNETLNTLKYANRARNIKNRAEVNEVEVGWEDVEHLQNLVLKLRRELVAIRSGNLSEAHLAARPSGRPLSSIDEESALSLRADFSDLQSKYAKAVADLAMAQQASERPMSPSGREISLSQSDFEGLIQPVVEEYEKSITSLESQLALTKAALAHSEESMKEQEERLEFESQLNETNAGVIEDLKSRVAKLAEREATTEGYIRDLETRLRTVQDHDEATNAVIADLRKEVSKYRDTEGNSERYIKELEVRLSKDDDVEAGLKQQVEILEREVLRREEAYKELEQRVALLDTSDQQKMLLQELDEREKKVLELERTLDEQIAEKVTFVRDKERLEADAKRSGDTALELQQRIKHLETAAAAAAAAAAAVETTRNQNQSTLSVLSPRSLTPPATPADFVDVGKGPDSGALQPIISLDEGGASEVHAQFHELQERYDQTVMQLENVNTKYKESLKELEDLSGQVEEARLIRSESLDRVPSPSPSPSPSLSSSALPASSGGYFPRGPYGPTIIGDDDVVETLSLSSASSTGTTPVKAPRNRRSVPINGRISFLGRPPVTNVTHARSMSLSQELSSAQNSLLPTPNSPRSHSPINREVERSYESLEQEVMKLQEVLKEREEEIAQLEKNIQDLRRQSTDSSGSSAGTSEVSRSDGVPTAMTSLNVAESSNDGLALSPNVVRVFDELKAQLTSDHGADGMPHEVDTKNIERLDDLMRSMAKKESAHLEMIEELKTSLASTRRQHEELQKLSRDQVVNMSTEIEGLRQRLSRSDVQSGDFEATLTEMNQALKFKQSELDSHQDEAMTSLKTTLESLEVQHRELVAHRDTEHSDSTRRLQEEHASVLRRMLDEREELFVSKTQEFEDLQRKMASEHESALAQATSVHTQALATKDEEHALAMQKASETFETEFKKLKDLHSASRGSVESERGVEHEKLVDSHAETLASRESAHIEAIAALEQSHEQTLAKVASEHELVVATLQQKHDDAMTRTGEVHGSTLTELREEHSSQIALLKESHATTLNELVKSHEQAMDDLEAQHATEVSNLTSVQEAHMDELRAEHEDILVASLTELDSRRTKKHEAFVETLQSEHAEALEGLRKRHEAEMKSLDETHQRAIGEMESGDRSVDSVRADHNETLKGAEVDRDETLSDLKRQHEVALAQQQSDHDTLIASLKAQHGEEVTSLSNQAPEGLSTAELMKQLKEEREARLIAEQARDKHAEKVSALTAEMEQPTTSRQPTPNSMITTGKAQSEVETELQEALDALSTLDKALHESQADREKLKAQLDEARKNPEPISTGTQGVMKYDSMFKEIETHRASIIALQSELGQTRQERDTLLSERPKAIEMGRRPSDASITSNGPHSRLLNGRADSPSQNIGFPTGPVRLTKAPPPTPPPSVPPPPLPTTLPPFPALPGLPTFSGGSSSGGVSVSVPNGAVTAVKNGHQARPSGSSSLSRSNSNSGRESPPENSRLESGADSRLNKRLDDQEVTISKLTKQLSHCETDLKANMDVVTNLEAALNECERNLRKSRLQMNDLAKERDKFSSQNEALRDQLAQAQSEADSARNSVLTEKAQFDARLSEERRAKEIARKQLESRMDEMQANRAARKSKFNCF